MCHAPVARRFWLKHGHLAPNAPLSPSPHSRSSRRALRRPIALRRLPPLRFALLCIVGDAIPATEVHATAHSTQDAGTAPGAAFQLCPEEAGRVVATSCDKATSRLSGPFSAYIECVEAATRRLRSLYVPRIYTRADLHR